ncbi:MAG: hypothetical protein WCP82_10585, partial [Alphaproteobacteria bacterium]
MQPFSLNQTGTLLPRQLAHFVSAIDTRIEPRYAKFRTPLCARRHYSQGLMQPFSLNQTGTLLPRQLAHFVSAI